MKKELKYSTKAVIALVVAIILSFIGTGLWNCVDARDWYRNTAIIWSYFLSVVALGTAFVNMMTSVDGD